ncbi:MAG: FIG000605: protein co-occurring with transport systems (COG1739) [uncultured Campylobacterales bacterium]|uniref:FIG000605: protein co-occurring with transport systems (COG1739) n=1 Tax=uncultured Campylobacterales bacterium TaxID=352960 RepID=A0A6S6TK50_9BACT|nr:MAG: FIG000605: protein co-occurring with transport systems (COG1739) [uncultured Campylobacterales bacterium]
MQEDFSTSYEVKKSKFISIITPYKNFHEKYQNLKNKHPKSSHIIYAYRYLNEYNQIVENSSDDGEPKGCAGKPTLNVMQGNKIINSCIFTVRYFGGTRLGTGGMVRAYSSSAKEVMKCSTKSEYIEKSTITKEISYKEYEILKYKLAQNNIEISSSKFLTDKIILVIKGTKEDLEKIGIKSLVTKCYKETL